MKHKTFKKWWKKEGMFLTYDYDLARKAIAFAEKRMKKKLLKKLKV